MITIRARIPQDDPALAAVKIGLTPPRATMARLERIAEGRVYAALQKWGKSMTRGITDDTVNLMLTRLDDPEFNRAMRDELIDVLQDVAMAGVDHGQRQIEQLVYARKFKLDIDWLMAHAAARKWALEYGYNLIRDITASTRKIVADEVRYFVDNGLHVNELRDRIWKTRAFDRTRAELIAITEVTRAYAEGNMAAWKESGVVKKKEWTTANDEMVCPICGPLHGVIVGMDELFNGRYKGPPAHPRCRCLVTPVIGGDTEEFGGMPWYEQLPREQWAQNNMAKPGKSIAETL